MKRYISIQDNNGLEFGIARCWTVEHWIEQASQWANDGNINFTLNNVSNMDSNQIITYISDLFDIQIEEYVGSTDQNEVLFDKAYDDCVFEYLDHIYKEVFLLKEDALCVPLRGTADEACDSIAQQPYFIAQFADIADDELIEKTMRLLGDGGPITSRHEALEYIAWVVACNYQENSYNLDDN